MSRSGPQTDKHSLAVSGAETDRPDSADAQRAELGITIPSWITPDLLANTLKTWQPWYDHALTDTDAVAILQSVGRLVDVLEGIP